jgi:hypothetical protein
MSFSRMMAYCLLPIESALSVVFPFPFPEKGSISCTKQHAHSNPTSAKLYILECDPGNLLSLMRIILFLKRSKFFTMMNFQTVVFQFDPEDGGSKQVAGGRYPPTRLHRVETERIIV